MISRFYQQLQLLLKTISINDLKLSVNFGHAYFTNVENYLENIEIKMNCATIQDLENGFNCNLKRKTKIDDINNIDDQINKNVISRNIDRNASWQKKLNINEMYSVNSNEKSNERSSEKTNEKSNENSRGYESKNFDKSTFLYDREIDTKTDNFNLLSVKSQTMQLSPPPGLSLNSNLSSKTSSNLNSNSKLNFSLSSDSNLSPNLYPNLGSNLNSNLDSNLDPRNNYNQNFNSNSSSSFGLNSDFNSDFMNTTVHDNSNIIPPKNIHIHDSSLLQQRKTSDLPNLSYIQNILNGSKLQNENESENKNSNKNRNENEKLNENKNESKNDENEFFYQNTDFDQNSVFKPDFIDTRSTHILSNLKEKNNSSENLLGNSNNNLENKYNIENDNNNFENINNLLENESERERENDYLMKNVKEMANKKGILIGFNDQLIINKNNNKNTNTKTNTDTNQNIMRTNSNLNLYSNIYSDINSNQNLNSDLFSNLGISDDYNNNNNNNDDHDKSYEEANNWIKNILIPLGYREMHVRPSMPGTYIFIHKKKLISRLLNFIIYQRFSHIFS